jgi:hypothetical protein
MLSIENDKWFHYQLNDSTFVEGYFEIKRTICEEDEVVGLDLELSPIYATKIIGEMEFDYTTNDEEIEQVKNAITENILSDSLNWILSEYISHEDKLWFNHYENLKIQQANEEKF